MSDKDAQNDLLAEIRKLLEKFQSGGELGPIEDRDDWSRTLNAHASQDRELLLELTRFADLWRYFQENQEKLGSEIVKALEAVPGLAVPERIQRMREINQELMERIPHAGEGRQFRN